MGSVSFERQPIADHATNLASTIQLNLKRSLEAIGVVRARRASPADTLTSAAVLDTCSFRHALWQRPGQHDCMGAARW